MNQKLRTIPLKTVIWMSFLIKLTLDVGMVFFGGSWRFMDMYASTIYGIWGFAGLCMILAVIKSNHRIKDSLIEIIGHLVLGLLAIWAFFNFSYFLFADQLPH